MKFFVKLQSTKSKSGAAVASNYFRPCLDISVFKIEWGPEKWKKFSYCMFEILTCASTFGYLVCKLSMYILRRVSSVSWTQKIISYWKRKQDWLKTVRLLVSGSFVLNEKLTIKELKCNYGFKFVTGVVITNLASP